MVSIASSDDWIAGNLYEEGKIGVPAVTLDALCERMGIEHIDWLKMNIEGAEKDAVLGMARMARKISNLTISCRDFLGADRGRSREQVSAWLSDH